MKRTLISETLKKIGLKVLLKGWINTIRSHGKITFFDLRDRTGIIQTVAANLPAAKSIGNEDVVEIQGLVKKRPQKLINPKIITGTIELEIDKINLLNKARSLPFPINTDGYEINEEIRMKYRYLDIRRPRMTRNLKLRSQATTFIRNFLTSRDFVEVETPILTKTTPEGARDFLVPSRLQPGKFYALPQSPQQYKQLLMVAGLERYFQIARCFRDEDPRKDRAYGEFTQLDLEMSFVTQEDILQLTEELFTQLVKTILPQKRIQKTPWSRISHKEAIAQYGSDKPDLRKNKQDADELAFVWVLDFPLFTKQTETDFYYGSGKAKFAPSHHMFVAPHPDDVSLLDTQPMKVRGLQHDLVLNGYEVGGGSIRIHQAKIQNKVFDLIGFTEKQKQQFEHMLTAFTYGAPPHGGIAPGIDRFLFSALGESSIREMMAFPASASGQISVMTAPSEATDDQLKELGIRLVNGSKKSQMNSGNVVFQKIKRSLDDNQIKYKVFEHEPVFTSEQAAKVRNTDIKQGAKALIMIGDKKPLVIVISAAYKINTSKFKHLFKIRDLRMAAPEEVKQITGVEIGAVPPFGNIFTIPTYVDETLAENNIIAFNAGLHTKSIEMLYADYKKVVKPQVGSFHQ